MPANERAAMREDLCDTVRGLLEKHSDLRGAMSAPRGYDLAVWSLLCRQVGVAGLAVPERYGGAGAGLAELGAVAHELGRTLTPSPLLGSAVLAAGAILRAGDDEACQRLLPAIADGSVVAAVAWAGADGRCSVGTTGAGPENAGPENAGPENAGPENAGPPIKAEAGGLRGTAHYVLDGDVADRLFVLAGEAGGVGLYEVDIRAEGLERVDAQALDPTRRLATVSVSTPSLRIGGLGPEALRQVRAEALAVLAAEQTGAAERALEMTVEHTLRRRQFGRTIGSFQAVKHRLADAYVRLEAARSACHGVFESCAEAVDDHAAAVAKVVCSESFEHIAAEMIQLHGGIAITWEHDAHLYFKRAHGSGGLFGHPQDYIDELGEQELCERKLGGGRLSAG